jgi:nitroreductase
MDALEAILTRTTVPPAKMGPPGPDEAQLRRILEAGASAPDHGCLRPWRFLVVRGAARERLGQLFAAAVRAKDAAASAQEVEKQLTSPLRASVVVAVVARIQRNHRKIPEVEQVASAAAAMQNMLLAAHAQGLAAKWVSGQNAYDPTVHRGLGLAPDDLITGFLFLGTPTSPHEGTGRPALESIVAEWTGEPAQ